MFAFIALDRLEEIPACGTLNKLQILILLSLLFGPENHFMTLPTVGELILILAVHAFDILALHAPLPALHFQTFRTHRIRELLVAVIINTRNRLPERPLMPHNEPPP